MTATESKINMTEFAARIAAELSKTPEVAGQGLRAVVVHPEEEASDSSIRPRSCRTQEGRTRSETQGETPVKIDRLDTMPAEAMRELLRDIRSILYADAETGELTRAKQWDSETIEYVANALDDAGISPVDEPTPI